MIFTGNDFMYLNFSEEYTMNRDRYFALRSNSKGVFSNSTWSISTVEKLIQDKSKELKPIAYNPGDLLPLSDLWESIGDAVWSGYYGNRPTTKLMAKQFGLIQRQSTAYLGLQLLQRDTFTSEDLESSNKLFDEAKKMQALLMHHDAITGTCSVHVYKDYQFKFTSSIAHLMSKLASQMNLTSNL